MAKFIIPPEKRGRKPRVSDEPLKKFCIYLPESLHNWCMKVRTDRIREIFSKVAAKDAKSAKS